jgi:hypothetical protein
LAGLVKELDKVADDNSKKKFAAVVHLLGKDAESLKKSAESLGEKQSPKHVALVVPVDNENGPKAFNVSPDAEVTVILYTNKKVAANHALAPGALNKEKVQAIVKDAEKMLE